MSEVKRRIIDNRKKGFFIMDDIYVDEFAKLLNPTATLIYLWLCRFADKEGTSFPGLNTLAERVGVNEKTIRRNLELLEAHNIIAKQRFGRTKTNRYHLLDRSEWKKVIGQIVQTNTTELTGQNDHPDDRTNCPDKPGGDWTFNDQVIGHLEPEKNPKMSNHSKETQLRKHSEKELIVTNVTIGNSVNEIMSILQEINQTINFANLTERKAAERIIARLGKDKAIASARAAVAAAQSGDQYAPSITTPSELEKKMGKLVNFYNKNSVKKPSVLVL